jgi:hypothetical protein
MNDFEEYGRKWSWANLQYYSDTGLVGRREITQKSVKIIRLGVEIWIQDLPDSKWHCQPLPEIARVFVVGEHLDEWPLGSTTCAVGGSSKGTFDDFSLCNALLSPDGTPTPPFPSCWSVVHIHEHSITVLTSTLKMEIARNSRNIGNTTHTCKLKGHRRRINTNSEQMLCFWTLSLSIVLFLSKTSSCLHFKTQRFGD